MGYAIISVGGKQYRVHEGERLLVDRVKLDDGATFTPQVLLVGGDGGVAIAPAERDRHRPGRRSAARPEDPIGKYKQRTGYRRKTGFRAALTQIEIESIGGAGRERGPQPSQGAGEACRAGEAAGAADEAARRGRRQPPRRSRRGKPT